VLPRLGCPVKIPLFTRCPPAARAGAAPSNCARPGSRFRSRRTRSTVPGRSAGPTATAFPSFPRPRTHTPVAGPSQHA
jgi:hypothetical protein